MASGQPFPFGEIGTPLEMSLFPANTIMALLIAEAIRKILILADKLPYFLQADRNMNIDG